MEPVESILKVYRDADAEYRLDLFLAHRDLRDRFTAIEASEEANRASVISRWKGKRKKEPGPRAKGQNSFPKPSSLQEGKGRVASWSCLF